MRYLKPLYILALFTLTVLSACGTDDLEWGSDNNSESGPVEYLFDCQTQDYPCNPADAEDEALERQGELHRALVNKVIKQEVELSSAAEWLSQQESVARVGLGNRGIKFRVEGSPPTFVYRGPDRSDGNSPSRIDSRKAGLKPSKSLAGSAPTPSGTFPGKSESSVSSKEVTTRPQFIGSQRLRVDLFFPLGRLKQTGHAASLAGVPLAELRRNDFDYYSRLMTPSSGIKLPALSEETTKPNKYPETRIETGPKFVAKLKTPSGCSENTPETCEKDEDSMLFIKKWGGFMGMGDFETPLQHWYDIDESVYASHIDSPSPTEVGAAQIVVIFTHGFNEKQTTLVKKRNKEPVKKQQDYGIQTGFKAGFLNYAWYILQQDLNQISQTKQKQITTSMMKWYFDYISRDEFKKEIPNSVTESTIDKINDEVFTYYGDVQSCLELAGELFGDKVPASRKFPVNCGTSAEGGTTFWINRHFVDRHIQLDRGLIAAFSCLMFGEYGDSSGNIDTSKPPRNSMPRSFAGHSNDVQLLGLRDVGWGSDLGVFTDILHRFIGKQENSQTAYEKVCGKTVSQCLNNPGSCKCDLQGSGNRFRVELFPRDRKLKLDTSGEPSIQQQLRSRTRQQPASACMPPDYDEQPTEVDVEPCSGKDCINFEPLDTWAETGRCGDFHPQAAHIDDLFGVERTSSDYDVTTEPTDKRLKDERNELSSIDEELCDESSPSREQWLKTGMILPQEPGTKAGVKLNSKLSENEIVYLRKTVEGDCTTCGSFKLQIGENGAPHEVESFREELNLIVKKDCGKYKKRKSGKNTLPCLELP